MANFISTILGFDFSKNSVSNVLNATVKIKDSIISIGPIFKQFQSHVDKMSHVTYWGGIATSAEKAFGGVKSAVSSVAKDLKKIYDFAGDYAIRGDKIAKTSRLVGLSVKDYQALSTAAEDSGMSIEEMDSALKKFNINLSKARGGDKTMLGNFSKALFGKDSDLRGLNSLKTTSDVLIALADSYSKLSSAEQKAFVSSELFGKSGLKMSEILSQGGQSLKDFLSSYEKGFSEEGAQKAEEFTHELLMMRKEFEKIKISVAQELFPAFKELFGEINSMLRGEKGSQLKNVLKEAGIAFKDFVLNLLPRIPKIIESIAKIVDFLTPELVAEAGIVLSILPILAKITLSLVTMWPLLKMFLSIGLKILGVVTALPTLVWSLVTGFKLAAVVVGGAFYAAVGGVLVLLGEMAYIGYQIYKNWDMLRTLTFDEFFGAIKMWIAEIAEWFSEKFRGIGEGIRDFVMGGLNTIYEAVQKIKGFLGGIFGSLPDRLQSFFGIGKAIDSANGPGAVQSLGASAAQAVSASSTTVTNRFAVDFKNMPRGVQVTPPSQGDFDWSRGYVLGGI